MNPIFKIIPTNICLFFLFSTILNAENFLEVFPNKPTPTLILALTQSDKNFIEEMHKYPKDTAFFIDGRTEQIIFTNQPPYLPKPSITQKPQRATPATPNKVNTPPKTKKIPKSNSYIPYQMQEETINILR